MSNTNTDRVKGNHNTNNILGQVINLADSVNYQVEAVVSHTIVSKEAGTVTLFAFAEGQGLSEHTAPFDAMVYILDGQAGINISGRSFCLETGQMIIMPAGKPHSLKAVKRFKMLLVMVKK